MKGVRLHGPRDLRVEEIPSPPRPGRGEVAVSVTAAGICGSDLHMYNHARTSGGPLPGPLVLGHEFAGVVSLCGADPVAGDGRMLAPGLRVAVDPATPCLKCDMCLRGDTHICRALRFSGLFPDDGCFRETVIAPARSCFALPGEIDDASGAMLEPLGVAMHAAGLAGIRKGEAVALFGAGPIGLLILQVALGAGAGSVYVVEPLPWRRALAERMGGVAAADAADITGRTKGKGVSAVFEAAWAGTSVQEAAECAMPGGRVVLVGIPPMERVAFDHATARRKELTMLFSRRMKETYPGAIRLLRAGSVDVRSLITHRFPLDELPAAFALNADYRDNVVKVIITSSPAS